MYMNLQPRKNTNHGDGWKYINTNGVFSQLNTESANNPADPIIPRATPCPRPLAPAHRDHET